MTLLDTRTKQEYEGGHVEGFCNIPLDELRGRMGELPVGKPWFMSCAKAAEKLFGLPHSQPARLYVL